MCSLMLSWASRPFHSTSMCDTGRQCAAMTTWKCVLILFSCLRDWCFLLGRIASIGVYMYSVCGPVWQQCIGLGFLLDCSQNLRGRVCPQCHIQNLSGVSAELNLVCFVLCAFFFSY